VDPSTAAPAFQRVIVVGTSGCGKTTFARRLAACLGLPHVELDRLFWLPGWQQPDREAFRRSVAERASAPAWVIDGNYGSLHDITWPRATHALWLNYAFPRVVWQVTRRTVGRVAARREVFPGCRETFAKSFLSRKSVIWWAISTYHRRQRQLAALRRDATFPQVAWIELRGPAEARAFWAALESAA
jgi:adenylate kinase family enzyme